MTAQPASGRRSALDRFAEKVTLTDSGCIEWTAGTRGVGYGGFYAGPERGLGYAHRWAYENLVGPIPRGMDIDHLCRNRRCVNPDHLEPVTRRTNVLRGEGPTARHAAKTHCPAGHEYAGENLYVDPSRRSRECRECARQRQVARRQAARRAA